MPTSDRSAENAAVRHRWTTRTRAVLEALRRNDRFRTPQQIYDEMRSAAAVSMGVTTLYRILHKLEEQQLVETQRGEGGELLYRAYDGSATHHNLVCRGCGHAERFTVESLGHQTGRVAQRFQFSDVNYRLDVYGTCRDCNQPSE
ncbi:transcriptional repressor [Nocardia uniformis]|uniref:Transcriptional repressor n=1 Tax=Nocardia uniformis TaxID=53432 RepID=A0A849C5Z4_9NOCA|nr:transcriptional repressor [Nocardia uniformis]NNH68391.1 transcriptional repressor [Nocardia uniformis]